MSEQKDTKKLQILWIDDEIELLKPHILYLESKSHEVDTSSNGEDALKKVFSKNFDIIFIDEQMPGLSGLETLSRIKFIFPNIPIVMITKSEEEDIMDQAIGSKISDYLIKPVNPKQLLLTIKKHIDTKRLIAEKSSSDYQVEFSKIGLEIANQGRFEDWKEIFKKLVYWELSLENSNDENIREILEMQKTEANKEFSRFIRKNYTSWFKQDNDKPLLSPSLMKTKVFPHLENGEKVFFILVDNLRYDQWKTIYPVIRDYLVVEEDDLYLSILPTSTQYARNAIFAGLMPLEISKLHQNLWIEEDADDSKNLYEEDLLKQQLKRLGMGARASYAKINNRKAGKKLVNNLSNLENNDLNVIVYNFVDMLSHARTEMEIIKELAEDDSSYRSLTLSWFRHSYFFDLLKQISELDARVIITTDHGSVRVNNPLKVIGDRETSTNLRYKLGKNLNYNEKEVFAITNPEDIHLPLTNVSSSYIFAYQDNYLVYPNNYNYYANHFKNTFQHGGISMEEMMIPCISLKPRR